MFSTRYIIMFVLTMTTVVALLLALLFTSLKDTHKQNEAIFNKRAILSAVEDQLGLKEGEKIKDAADQVVLDIFNSKVTQVVLDMEGNEVSKEEVEAKGYKGGLAEHIDMKKEKKKPEAERILPLFIFKIDAGEQYYITSVRGNGLWDEIWGNIALKSDLNTIVGASFDHQGETPGLGAEIKDNPAFPNSFKGKQIYDESGEYVSVDVIKGGAAADNLHGVDGISGATVTADGVAQMLYYGIEYYEPYFDKLKNEDSKPLGQR